MRRCLFEPEHVDYRESVRRFVAEEVTPHQAQWEADGIVDRELFAKAAAKGMLAMQVPEEYGGSGVDDFRFNQIVGEELGVAGSGGSGLGPHAAQRHLPALLPGPVRRRAAAALAARHRRRVAHHRRGHDRAGDGL